jgi:hypothetical protein
MRPFRVHDHSSARLQLRPRRASEEEHQVDFFPTIAIPLLVGDVLEPVEVCHRSVVEQHVDAAERAHGEVDQRLAVGWLGEMAWLQGGHRTSRSPNQVHCGLRRVDRQIAADDRRTLASERHCGRSADAAAGAGDDADLS